MLTLAQLRDLAANATPGPWWYSGTEADNLLHLRSGHPAIQARGGRYGGRLLAPPADASPLAADVWLHRGDPEYVAAANPLVVVELLDRLDRAVQLVARLLDDTPNPQASTTLGTLLAPLAANGSPSPQ